jgi:hypothetical protein
MTSNFANPKFFQKRPTESQFAYEARVRMYLPHREDAQADAKQAHAEFREQQEARTSGTGYGLAGDLTPVQRAQVVKAAGVQAGEQRIAANGALFWEANHLQPGVRRIYASEIGEGGPGVSGSGGEGWH